MMLHWEEIFNLEVKEYLYFVGSLQCIIVSGALAALAVGEELGQ